MYTIHFNMRNFLISTILMLVGINLSGQNLPPKRAYPYNVKQIHSGHSLTDPLFFPHWPGQYVTLMNIVRGVWAGDDIGKSTIPGSPMRWRWHNSSGYPDARHDISEFELLSITEVAGLCYEGGNNAQWYLDCIREQRDFMSLFTNNAWNNGNNGQGAATLLYTNWVNIDGSDGPFRQTLDILGGEWERIQDHANRMKPTNAPHVYIIPGHKMMARIYDDVQEGKVPGVSRFSEFFSDNIHVSEIGAYAVAMLHYACIYNLSPVGLPHILVNNPPPGLRLPTPALARYIQEMVWDVVTSYPRTGIYINQLSANISASKIMGEAPMLVEFDASLSVVTDSVTYLWDFGDGHTLNSGFRTSHLYTTPGVYTATVLIKDQHGNESSASINITVLEGETSNAEWLQIHKNASIIDIAPNPGNQYFTVLNRTENLPIQIFNAQGRLMLVTHSNTINTADLISGVYIIRIGEKSTKWIKL